ncbi:MAG: SWIM zinc finger family protein [Candidatus Eremiobacterota bacterium]
MVASKRIVRWETYERDKDNMIASYLNGYWTVLSFGKKTKTSKKEIPVRQYRVSKDQAGNVTCTCDDFIKNNSICKHQIKVWEKARQDKKQAAEQKKQEIEKIIARW